MSKLPQIRPRELEKILVRSGFELKRSVGSHARFIHLNGRRVTIAMHNWPIPKGTLKAILRQADLTVEDLE